MVRKLTTSRHGSVAMWAKRCYLAGRIAMEAALRPYDLGATQWFVLYQLAEDGPTMQRDLLRLLQVERATLSVVVTSLVRKGLVEQVADHTDQRQKRLRLTEAGMTLWNELPDMRFIHTAAFEGIDDAELEIAVKVLRIATERLDQLAGKGPTT